MNVKIPEHGVLYFLIITFVLFLGIVIIIFQSAVTHPGLVENNDSGLQAYYGYHVTFVTPYMSTVFVRLFLSNAGVALFILLVPLYWVWIWWLNRALLSAVTWFMRGTVILLILALGHNSFRYAYVTFSTYPFPVFMTMYFPHGWLEILAFILSGTFSLVCIDALRVFISSRPEVPALHPGEVALFIFNRVWRIFLVIACLLAVAAAIECWITPRMVTAILEQVLL
ncbi:MAG: stage II sporulation protein M [Methanoregula sp.]|nr:stage II sporulation protein M [Methanoregula sp.]